MGCVRVCEVRQTAVVGSQAATNDSRDVFVNSKLSASSAKYSQNRYVNISVHAWEPSSTIAWLPCIQYHMHAVNIMRVLILYRYQAPGMKQA